VIISKIEYGIGRTYEKGEGEVPVCLGGGVRALTPMIVLVLGLTRSGYTWIQKYR